MSLIIINDLDKDKLSDVDKEKLTKAKRHDRYIDRDIYLFYKENSNFAKEIYANIRDKAETINTFGMVAESDAAIEEKYNQILQSWKISK
jgi:hypothetical protein